MFARIKIHFEFGFFCALRKRGGIGTRITAEFIGSGKLKGSEND